jgi:hypothetical protein
LNQPDQKSIEAERRQTRALAAAGDPLARAQVEAWARAERNEGSAANMASVAAMLPAAARVAVGAKRGVINPKIWAEDVRRWRPGKFVSNVWRSAARLVARARAKGDVLQTTIWGVCDLLERESRKARGKAEITLARIADLTGCCLETARKVVRYLENAELIDTFNVLSRKDGKVLRDANMYLLRMPADGPAIAPDILQSPQGVFARLNETLSRWAANFNLIQRDWGLNATPLSGVDPRRRPPPD